VLRGLAREIGTMHGTEYLMQGAVLGDEAGWVTAFTDARAAEYREMLGRCRAVQAELDTERAAAHVTFSELEENEDAASTPGRVRGTDDD